MYRLLLCFALVGCRAWRERREAADDQTPAAQDDGSSGGSGSGASSSGGSGESDADTDSDADSDADSGGSSSSGGSSEADGDTDTDTDSDGDSDADTDTDADSDGDSDADLSGRYEGEFTLHVVGAVVEYGYTIDDTCVGTAVAEVDAEGVPEIVGDATCAFSDILADYLGEQTGSVEGAVDDRGTADGTITVTFGTDSLSAEWEGEADGVALTGIFGDSLTYPIGSYTLEAEYTGSFELTR